MCFQVYANSEGLGLPGHPHSLIRPRGYKTFSMLNSDEHEICPANKSQITNNCKIPFLLNIAEHKIFSANKYENAN